MKYSKVAAVVAGSMMAIGAGAAAATPAFAAEPPAMPPMSLNGGLDQATQSLQQGAAVPVAAVADTATSLATGKADAGEQVLGLARQATPMLGGVQLGNQ
ncbi:MULTISPECIES: hypothetical protein [unclassified Streptomyces]|uniref:hypothetical protein n=1 Tax=unclassified Streptomyces TaxID=2593676 RepID=UPI0013C082E0|nr:hypothetical protein [Streptomyces sp. SID10853]NDZ83593.1 hypothetical protein [Streptomyces sp. SID10853]WSU42873.1 hypothetical protein OG510_17295 [Streptomyces sp. NBC_01089]